MSQQSECGVHYTNMLLQSHECSSMPEKIITENSGHKSTKALRCYEHTSSEQQKSVSKVISNPGDVFQSSATECFGGNESHKATPEPSPLTTELFQNFLEVANLHLVLHSPTHLLTHSLVTALLMFL